MTSTDRLTAWIDGYVGAWNSNDPTAIGALFAEEGEYYTEPFAEPWRGRDRIVRQWLERKDKPGETTFRWVPLVVTDETAVVQGTTQYPAETFSNLWVIRFDESGRCREFTEWWMSHPAAA